ncbi:hypothetical protein Micbo1qcDRAFT_222804 [Microdochium bolleyi]|uniref:Uncharacterized protein n=1 Tax=Microdochium bolleyi TaxID=196109 RepID=A0A136J7J6_9PEZI|nr:hypothetical protein Micbo1qcDRAFT_222804 [Microdochium bolleyi]
MAPGSTNFKTYEAQTRLLAAVIATTNVKLDFNGRLRPELAKHAGNNCTPSSIDHRLRPIKQLARLQRACVASGEDPAELPTDKEAIQKLFGESTAGGLEWQFRDIKKIGKAQKEAVANGQSPVGVMNGIVGKRGGGGSAASTPSGRASKHATAPTPGSRSTLGGGSARKRKINLKKSHTYEDSNEGSGGDDSDYSAKDIDLEATPSRKRNKPVGNGGETPRAAPVVGSSGSAQLFAAQRPQQQQQPQAFDAPAPANQLCSTASTPATTATLTISPRKPPPKNYEVIDLSGASPEGSGSNTTRSPPLVAAPSATVAAQQPVKAECTGGTRGSGAGGTAPAYSFDGARDDPFAGFDGYANPDMSETGYDGGYDAAYYGRPASDDEC